MNKSSFFILSLMLFALGCERSEETPANSHEASQGRTQPNPRRAETARETALSGSDIATFEQLSERISTASYEDLQKIAYNIQDLLEKYPDRAEETLRLIARALAKSDPIEAARFSSHCTMPHSSSWVVMKEVAQTWHQDDPKGFEKALVSLTDPDLGAAGVAKDLLSSLLGDPTEASEVSSWMGWVDSLTSPELAGMVLDTLLDQRLKLDDEAFDALREAYTARMKDPEFQDYLPNFGEALAAREPEHTVSFLDKVPGGFYHERTTLRIINALALTKPEVAVEWLSQDNILETLFKPDAEAAANISQIKDDGSEEALYELEMLRQNRKGKFDPALASSIRTTSQKFPEDAYRSLDAIHSPELAETLKKELDTSVPPRVENSRCG